MTEPQLYTVDAFQVLGGDQKETEHVNIQQLIGDARSINEYPNMISARVIQGKTLELEHSYLAGPAVKFKTIVNFDKALDSKSCLGVVLTPQTGYKTKNSCNLDSI